MKIMEVGISLGWARGVHILSVTTSGVLLQFLVSGIHVKWLLVMAYPHV